MIHEKRRPISAREGEKLALRLTALCHSFGPGQREHYSHLSGGLDRRVRYETVGEAASDDVRLACSFAKSQGLSHNLLPTSTSDVIQDWPKASWRITLQTDGLAGLWHVPEVLHQPNALHTSKGIYAGLAAPVHPLYMDEYHMVRGRAVERVREHLAERFDRHYGGLVSENSREITQRFIGSFVDEWIARDFRPIEIPEVFFAL